MEKKAHYFIVGLFVIIGFTAMIGFAIWLAGSKDENQTARYTVYFTDPVSGLNEGASVQYRGVDVGKVLDVKLDETRNDLIKVNIEVDKSAPIHAETQATLAMLGITGLVYIELSTEPDDTAPAKTVEGEKYPVLKGNGTQLAKVFQDIPGITRQIREIATKFNALLDQANMDKLSDTLANAEKMTRDLNGLLSSTNVTNASTALDNIAQASNDAKGMINRLQKTAENIESTVRKLNDIINVNQANINKFSNEGLRQILETTDAAHKMVDSIRDVIEKIERDPSQVIYRQKPAGVDIPKK